MINATQARAMANENSGLSRLLKEFDQAISVAAAQGKFEANVQTVATHPNDKLLEAAIEKLSELGYKTHLVCKAVREEFPGRTFTSTIIVVRVYWE